MNTVIIGISWLVLFVIGYAVGCNEERKRIARTMRRENFTIRPKK